VGRDIAEGATVDPTSTTERVAVAGSAAPVGGERRTSTRTTRWAVERDERCARPTEHPRRGSRRGARRRGGRTAWSAGR
jgi:hypothetical protein